MTRHIFDAVGFFVCIAAILSLLLVGCGTEPVPEDAGLVEVRESCTVTLLPDGQVKCVCVEVTL